MNRKHIDPNAETEQSNGQYAVKRSRKADIIAVVVCLLVAFVVWLAFMSKTETDYVELCVSGVEEASCEYSLSVTQVELSGTVHNLRNAKYVRVVLPADLAPGEYEFEDLDNAHLELPEGTVLASALDLTITVTAK